MSELKFKPLSNYVVIEAREKLGGKVWVDKKNLPRDRVDFIVLAVSDEKDLNGNPFVKNIKVGDNIIPDTSVNALVLNIGKREVIVMRETNIIGILEPDYEQVESNLVMVN